MYSTQESEKVPGTSLMTNPSHSADTADQYSMTDWQALASMDQNLDFNVSAGLSSYGARIPQCQEFNASIAGTRPSFFGNESFPQMANSFALPESCQIADAFFPTEFTEAKNNSIEKNLKGKKRKTLGESGSLHPHPPLVPLDKVQDVKEAHEDGLLDSAKNPTEKDEKKQKTVPNLGAITSKTNAKHAKEQSHDGNASKEDYIHVRAKRGQATNSHSLAERVRREKISERMRLLQDLVPGCNKITGKAVMLDEIINYVQSLQRQVEFLSMKLAAVSPELNFDLEQIFLKDILHPRDGGSAILGFGPGMSSLHPHLYASSPPPQGAIHPEMVSSVPQISTMAPMSSVWHDEMQNVFRRGFNPHAPPSDTDREGSMKVEP